MDNVLRWNWPNFFTVGLMALVFGAALSLAGALIFGDGIFGAAGDNGDGA